MLANIQQTEAEAAAFRSLIAHLQQRSDVQNIDLMNLAGFCRNCLSKWYSAEVRKVDPEFDYADAQKYVYGMTNEEWKMESISISEDTHFSLLTFHLSLAGSGEV